MSKLWNYLIFHAWMSYLMTAGLLLFTSGFLLNRVSRQERNECDFCSPLEDCNDKTIFQNPEKAANICTGSKSKVVLLIVDALKYEFAAWYDDPASEATYHRNKLPALNEILKKYPQQSRLYKFIADPPTTTLQRLKGLVTGSLPTFIDMSSNFGSESIDEDNLIDQTINNGVVFMGDDTWVNLFPNKFLRQFPSPSFNVWDLDSVDRDVQYRIFFELKKKDWSLLIAHVLGIDHCGHKHGPYHPEMTRKLNDTNTLITEIVDSLEPGTMLFIVGDHGMTATGDHGGDSPDELEAAMFVYSTVPLNEKNFVEGMDRINQIDLVPTLASILGIAVPFSNLGFVILDSLPKDTKTDSQDILQYPLHSMWRNIAQTKKYIDVYSSDSNTFSKHQLKALNEKYLLLSKQIKYIENENDFHEFIRNAREYIELLKNMCTEVWVQFDSGLISKGLILMFCTLFFFYLFVTGVPDSRMSEIFKSMFLQYAVMTNVGTVLIIGALYYLNIIEELRNLIFFSTGILSISLLVILIIQNWDVIFASWYNSYKFKKLNYIMRVILLLTVCSLFSNSYIIEEDYVLSFLLITLMCLLIFNVRKDDYNENSDKRNRIISKPVSRDSAKTVALIIGLLACIAVRLSVYFWRCREEQRSRICSAFIAGKTGSVLSQGLEKSLLFISLVALALYITVVKIWLRTCGNLSGFAPSVIIGQYCPVVIGVCIGCYWVLQRFSKFGKVKLTLSWQVNALPNTIYFICSVAIFLLYYRPLSVFLLPKKRESIDVHTGENLVPRLFEKIKDSIYRKDKDIDETPVVYGLGTVYSAAFILLSVFLVLLYSLLLGDILSSSVFLMTFICASILCLTGIERCKNANNIQELLKVPTLVLFCWFLVAEYFFYGTGHQSSFLTIHWDAAYIGTGGTFYSNMIPAALIGINTFGSHIILGLTLPLLVIVPLTMYLMFPKLARLKFLENDLKRGELVLFEQDTIFHAAIFSVSGKYILIHAIRTFGSMLAATIHCRHLMVWKIFAPKLIFEGLGLLVTLGSVIASFYMVFRIDRQLEYLIKRITKSR